MREYRVRMKNSTGLWEERDKVYDHLKYAEMAVCDLVDITTDVVEIMSRPVNPFEVEMVGLRTPVADIKVGDRIHDGFTNEKLMVVVKIEDGYWHLEDDTDSLEFTLSGALVNLGRILSKKRIYNYGSVLVYRKQ